MENTNSKKNVPLLMLLLVTLAFTFLVSGFAPKLDQKTDSESEKIWVVRSDGARSCGVQEGEPVDQATAELKKAGVTVFESRKGVDGKMHAMVCGASEGTLNAFLIPEKDLPKTIVLGFSKAPKDFVLK